MTKQKLASKNKKKGEIRQAAVALNKKKQKQDEAKTPADAPWLPPPMEAPPGTDESKAPDSKQPMAAGVFRVAKDMAGMSLFG